MTEHTYSLKRRGWRDSVMIQVGVLAITIVCLPLYLAGVSWAALWTFVAMPYFAVSLLHRRWEAGSWRPYAGSRADG